jgi:hypothetical protein
MMKNPSESSAIELHDPVLADVNEDGGRFQIGLGPAHIHKSAGVPGTDAGTGWVQKATLVLAGASVEGQIPDILCDRPDGTLVIGEAMTRNDLPRPLDQRGQIALTLEPMWGGRLVFRGEQVAITLLGKPKCVELFSGSGSENQITTRRPFFG